MALGSSFLLHAVIVLTLPRSRRVRPATPARSVELSLDIVSLPSTSHEQEPPAGSAAVGEPVHVRREPPERPFRADSATVDAESAAAADANLAPALAETATHEPDRASQTRGSRTIDLSPLAAARSVVDVRAAPGLTVSSAREHRAATQDRVLEAKLAASVEGLARRGNASVHQQLARGFATSLSPWELVLRPLEDGRYRYEGQGFAAIIRDDGSVEMRDHSGVHFVLVPIRDASNMAAKARGGLSFPSPIEWLANTLRNNDPHHAERVAFLESTRELRELLLERAQKRQLARADAELARELKRIWSKQGAEWLAGQQAQTFALWDECSEDEVGQRRRAQIEAFTRELCPPASACEFRPQVLARLNSSRQSDRMFVPYGEALSVASAEEDAGTLPSTP